MLKIWKSIVVLRGVRKGRLKSVQGMDGVGVRDGWSRCKGRLKSGRTERKRYAVSEAYRAAGARARSGGGKRERRGRDAGRLRRSFGALPSNPPTPPPPMVSVNFNLHVTTVARVRAHRVSLASRPPTPPSRRHRRRRCRPFLCPFVPCTHYPRASRAPTLN